MSDRRHQRRQKLLQDLFASTFSDRTLEQRQTEEVASGKKTEQSSQKNADTSHTATLTALLDSLEELDVEIASAAPERPINEISKVDLAILRLILFESHQKKTPKKVLVDEAIELAKEFGSESSPRFINGVLAKLLLDQSPAST